MLYHWATLPYIGVALLGAERITIRIIMSRYFAYLTKRHHPEERERWFRAIQRDNIPDGPNTFVCEHHWPKDYETIIKYGKARPKYPPSVFTQCVVPSQVPTPLPPPRPTTKADASSLMI